MGFRPGGNKRADLGVSSAGAICKVRQHRGAGGAGLVIRCDFVGMNGEFNFTMDTPVDRNYFCLV